MGLIKDSGMERDRNRHRGTRTGTGTGTATVTGIGIGMGTGTGTGIGTETESGTETGTGTGSGTGTYTQIGTRTLEMGPLQKFILMGLLLLEICSEGYDTPQKFVDRGMIPRINLFRAV
jgi:hypothetical protein